MNTPGIACFLALALVLAAPAATGQSLPAPLILDEGELPPGTFPDASTTGLSGCQAMCGTTDPGQLPSTSGRRITQAGTTIQCENVNGEIEVNAANVTLQCLYIDGGAYGIQCGLGGAEGCRDLLIEDVEIVGAASSGILAFQGPTTIRRASIHDTAGDGIKAERDVVIEDSYIRHLRDNGSCDAHADGNQTRFGENLVFRRNNFVGRFSPTDHCNSPGTNINNNNLIQAKAGSIDNIVIEGNRFEGGHYLFGLNAPKFDLTNVVVRNNVGVKDSWTYGPLQQTCGGSAQCNGSNPDWNSLCLVWHGNTFHDGSPWNGPSGARSSGVCSAGQ